MRYKSAGAFTSLACTPERAPVAPPLLQLPPSMPSPLPPPSSRLLAAFAAAASSPPAAATQKYVEMLDETVALEKAAADKA